MLSEPALLSSMQRGSARMVKEWIDNPANIQKYLEGLK
jgi:hypothetical protein